MTEQYAEQAPEGNRTLPFAYARRHQVLSGVVYKGQLSLICTAETPAFALQEAGRQAGTTLPLAQVTPDEFAVELGRAYQNQGSMSQVQEEELAQTDLLSLADSVPESEDLAEQAEDAPIVRLVNAILAEALREEASDIHLETFEQRLVVRFRVDGVLREVLEPRRALAPLLTSRLKVMARLDIAEKRLPQDGRIALRVAGREVDVRVSTLPASHGERVVLRLLDKQAGPLTLARLGMTPADKDRLRQLIAQPHGIILVTGPTGSGKTTSLYAALTHLNSAERNIMTVEDPIEYTLPGIGQTQVNPRVDMTFARGLRAILRQDPDVVMIGEIRDRETVDIAVQASLTGHLVLSTLHTNSAVGAITRLQDMGVEPFLLASSLSGVLAQRLVRVLCPQCRRKHKPGTRERRLLGLSPDATAPIYVPEGCPACKHTGYRGRTGLYELLVVDQTLRALIHDNAGEQAIVAAARATQGEMLSDGINKVLSGVTSLPEVLRVCELDPDF